MLPLTIHVTKYFKDKNFCEGSLASGELVAFDPFVCCAITLSDEDYAAGKGGDTVHKNYLLTSFSVQPWYLQDGQYHYEITPNECGLIAL